MITEGYWCSSRRQHLSPDYKKILNIINDALNYNNLIKSTQAEQ